mmetsp:Transcript_5475/g.22495  ORF Transcript_5475/g.22495 Transcript_5475/m.22495 type:complete len:332 (-) Transcript_5475:3591-4586(-)
MDDVGFEQAAESKVEKLERHERALPGIGIFLILHGSLDGVHDAIRLERRYAAPLDRAGETERGAAPICVSLSVGDLRQEALHQRPAFVIRQCLHQRREAVRHGPLHSLGGCGQHGDKPGEDLPDLGIRGVQVARQCPEEDHDALTDVIALRLVLGAAPAPRRLRIKIFFIHREQLLHLFGAMQLDHVTPRGHGRVAHELIVVAEHLGEEGAHQREVPGRERRRHRAESAHDRGASLGVTRAPRRSLLPRERGQPPLPVHRRERVVRVHLLLLLLRRVLRERAEQLRQRGSHALLALGDSLGEGSHRGVPHGGGFVRQVPQKIRRRNPRTPR